MRPCNVAGAATGALIGLALGCQAAHATPGYLNQGMNLRAGPGVDYPWIASLPPGTQAEIFGCLPGWNWCDVATEGLRGWVAGIGLQVLYDGQPEPLAGYGGEIGLPFIGFDFGNYWGQYYRGRPWYSQVDRWHGPGGPRGDWGGRPGRPDGNGNPGPEGDGRGGFAGHGPDHGGLGGPGNVQSGIRPGFAGPSPIQGGPRPGLDRGNEDRGPQPGFRPGGEPRGGMIARGPVGPGGGQQGGRPGGEAHPGNPKGPGPSRGGPDQHDPR